MASRKHFILAKKLKDVGIMGWRLRSKKKLKEDYGREASTYDKVRFESPGGRFLDGIEKETILKWLKNGSILELGVGTGRFAIFLAKGGHEFTGIDITPAMMEVASLKAKKENIKLKLIQMDAENLNFPPSSFDNVLCSRTFAYFHNPNRVLKGVHNVLREGGRLIIVTPSQEFLFARIAARLRCAATESRLYSWSGLKKMLEEHKFKLKHHQALFNFPTKTYLYGPKMLIKLVEKIDNKILNNGWYWFVVAEKRPENLKGKNFHAK